MKMTEFVLAVVLYAVNVMLSLYISRKNYKSNYLFLVLFYPIFSLIFMAKKEEEYLPLYGHYWLLTGTLVFLILSTKCIGRFLDSGDKDLSKIKSENKVSNRT